MKVYPHVCGGIAPGLYRPHCDPGLSPRVRGHRAKPGTRPAGDGSIPTCAGASAWWIGMASWVRVYPHVCGGILEDDLQEAVDKGLSPRVRGHHSGLTLIALQERSIPTCAGASRRRGCGPLGNRVYPHVCGGIADRAGPVHLSRGLSPRVRGHHNGITRALARERSIPTCAGASTPQETHFTTYRVYPHVCGGIASTPAGLQASAGLSPRVRGHLWQEWIVAVGAGSIPTCAGASRGPRSARGHSRVYPHVCGGITRRLPGALRRWGLSPRVRGHLTVMSDQIVEERSIPTCAGASPHRSAHLSSATVYPHVCGGI